MYTMFNTKYEVFDEIAKQLVAGSKSYSVTNAGHGFRTLHLNWGTKCNVSIDVPEEDLDKFTVLPDSIEASLRVLLRRMFLLKEHAYTTLIDPLHFVHQMSTGKTTIQIDGRPDHVYETGIGFCNN